MVLWRKYRQYKWVVFFTLRSVIPHQTLSYSYRSVWPHRDHVSSKCLTCLFCKLLLTASHLWESDLFCLESGSLKVCLSSGKQNLSHHPWFCNLVAPENRKTIKSFIGNAYCSTHPFFIPIHLQMHVFPFLGQKKKKKVKLKVEVIAVAWVLQFLLIIPHIDSAVQSSSLFLLFLIADKQKS